MRGAQRTEESSLVGLGQELHVPERDGGILQLDRRLLAAAAVAQRDQGAHRERKADRQAVARGPHARGGVRLRPRALPSTTQQQRRGGMCWDRRRIGRTGLERFLFL